MLFRSVTKKQICFSHKYNKLSNPEFTTVRWLDSNYRLGEIYDVYLVGSDMFHRKYEKGRVRLIKMEIKKLKELSIKFIIEDADCDREAFMKMMEGWYKNKPDWKGEDSEIQILYLEKVD